MTASVYLFQWSETGQDTINVAVLAQSSEAALSEARRVAELKQFPVVGRTVQVVTVPLDGFAITAPVILDLAEPLGNIGLP